MESHDLCDSFSGEAKRIRCNALFDAKIMRLKSNYFKMRSKLSMAWTAFRADPMDLPVVEHAVTISFTLNMETGEIKRTDSQDGTKD